MHEFRDEFLQDAILEKLQRLTGTEFEEFLASFYIAQGYLVDNVGGAGDDGIDLMIEHSGVKYAVQCKRWEGTVDPATIREFIGAVLCSRVTEGFLITTGDFSENVRSFAKGAPIPITLVSGTQLARWIEQHWKQEIAAGIEAEIQASAKTEAAAKVAAEAERLKQQRQRMEQERQRMQQERQRMEQERLERERGGVRTLPRSQWLRRR